MPANLTDLVKRYTDARPGSSPYDTPVPGLVFLRSDQRKRPSHLVFRPALCVVAQGAKWTTFGGKRFDYKAGQALVVSVETPALSRVVKASPSEPYLGVIVEFDLTVMRAVLEELPAPPQPMANVRHGIFVTHFQGNLADCVMRLVRLIDTPQAIAVIAPMIMRELCYWLLTGPHGSEVAGLVLANGHAERVIRAIHALRDQFAEPVRIDHLAAIARMSPTAFHRQFKALTSMTPLQYQKQLRLLEARHLMVSGAANAESAAYRVGYESASQFSREYARMFGAPPRRDVSSLQTAAV